MKFVAVALTAVLCLASITCSIAGWVFFIKGLLAGSVALIKLALIWWVIGFFVHGAFKLANMWATK